VIQDDVCFFCQREPESAGHALWECPSSRDVWAVCGRRIQKSAVTGMTFKEIMEWLMRRCNRQELELRVVIAKRIWARRNQVLHGGEFISSIQTGSLKKQRQPCSNSSNVKKLIGNSR
jgi:hypothetical protein